ncbi:glycosyltransferase [Patescibacteria group bacterium]
MKIGIDISQIVYEGAGVATHVGNIVREMVSMDKKNEYVLFGSAFRQYNKINDYCEKLKKINNKVQIKLYPFPPILLDFFWNKLHIFPIEWLVGSVDIFWSSDWTQPPLSHATGVTTIHDLIYQKYPDETNPSTSVSVKNLQVLANIVATQKRRIKWVKKECKLIFCDSSSTKNDIVKYLGIHPDKLKVVYPGI